MKKVGRKKQARSNKQQSKVTKHHPKLVTFPKKNGTALGGIRTHNTLHSRQSMYIHMCVVTITVTPCTELQIFNNNQTSQGRTGRNWEEGY